MLATNFSFEGQTDIYRGEVRDVYEIGDKLVQIATDRLTVFGHLFPQSIPYKGQVLNQLTEYFANATKDIAPNWLETSPDPNVSIGKKCQPFDVNIVIRGALIGHAWRVYESGSRSISGVEIPEGLEEYELFEEPLITPSTKAQNGFEEDITAGEIIERGLMSEAQFERLSIVARQLFIRGKQMARKQGLILADAKYEFGLLNDEIYVIDELHTPDSARYFSVKDHTRYMNTHQTPPEHLSTEYARLWLLDQGYSGLDDQIPPVLDEKFINLLSNRYIKLYEQITGMTFEQPNPKQDPLERIRQNVAPYLKNLSV